MPTDGGSRAFSTFVEKAINWSDVHNSSQGSYRFSLLDTFFSDSIPVELFEQIFRRSSRDSPGRLLIVDPTSPYAVARAMSIGGATCQKRAHSGLEMLATAMQGATRLLHMAGISLTDLSNLNISELAREVHELGNQLNIAVRFYSIAPSGPLYFFRDILLSGRFSVGVSAVELPWTMVIDDPTCNGDQYDILLREFNHIWDRGYDQPGNIRGRIAPRDQNSGHQKGMDGIRIFVSHASKDMAFAQAIVKCIEDCIEVPENTIRCTSVSGYKLLPGDDSDKVLLKNIEQCSVVIGLITQESLKSGYVIMELGAAWGLGKRTCAVVSENVDFNVLPGPMPRVHATRANNNADIATLIELIANYTDLQLRNNVARFNASVCAFAAGNWA
jgi:hypothetical protein